MLTPEHPYQPAAGPRSHEAVWSWPEGTLWPFQADKRVLAGGAQQLIATGNQLTARHEKLGI